MKQMATSTSPINMATLQSGAQNTRFTFCSRRTYRIDRCRRTVMVWRTRSSRFDSSSSDGGGTRLIRAIRGLQTRIGVRFQELRKNLPLKLLFFLVGFYCATAFATVIGQTGDWDILSAALAVAVVEAIGALMYKNSLRLFSNVKSLVTVFNYWKAGLSLGLFLDSFKYDADKLISFDHLLHFDLL